MSEYRLDYNGMDGRTFLQYYHLKEELVEFCRSNGLQSVGSKSDLTERIVHYLDTGEKSTKKAERKSNAGTIGITNETIIGANFSCSERNRQFFEDAIGMNFKFKVPFQRWLKANPDKTVGDAILAYPEIIENMKREKPEIDGQFEYNTYIRDFFKDNKGRSLNEAILCWKYKKALKGHNRYESTDLAALK